MGGASGGLGLRFDAGGVRADGAGGLWAGRLWAGGLDGARGLWAGGLDGARGLRAGWLGTVVNKTPPTLQKQAGSSGLHQIVTQRGGQGVNKTLQCVGVTV